MPSSVEATEIVWKGPYYGADFDNSVSFSREIKKKPGIYIWRKVFKTDTEFLADVDSFLSWITSTANSPLASTDELIAKSKSGESISIRSEYARITRLVIGSGDISSKNQKIEEMAGARNDRENLYDMLLSASHKFGPVLYVGETDDLCRRVKEHLAVGSGFRKKIEDIGLSINDVAFYYMELPEFEYGETERKAIESILTHALGAPLTTRAG